MRRWEPKGCILRIEKRSYCCNPEIVGPLRHCIAFLKYCCSLGYHLQWTKSLFPFLEGSSRARGLLTRRIVMDWEDFGIMIRGLLHFANSYESVEYYYEVIAEGDGVIGTGALSSW